MAANRLQFIDYLILDHIKRYGVFNDAAMSRQLACPRIMLLKKLNCLLTEGYLAQQEASYVLTVRGKREWIPLDRYYEPLPFTDELPNSFSWEDIYVPPPGWQDK